MPMSDEKSENGDLVQEIVSALSQLEAHGKKTERVSKGNGVLQAGSSVGLVALLVLGWNMRGDMITKEDVDPKTILTTDDIDPKELLTKEDLDLRLNVVIKGQEANTQTLRELKERPIPDWFERRVETLESEVRELKKE